MVTIKAYTDLGQSKKLAEILPIKSADMYYKYALPKSDRIIHTPEIGNPINSLKWYNEGYTFRGKREPITLSEYCVPAWSLAGLLGVLPPYLYEWEKGIDFSLYPSVAKKRWWCAGYISQDLSPENKDKFTLITHADTPIDACYEMILKLNELNLL